MQDDDDDFNVNAPGTGEFVFEQTVGGNDETYGNVIVISDDDGDIVNVDGDDSNDGNDYFDANSPGVGDFEAYEEYMRRRPVIGPSIRNFERFTYEEYVGRISPVIDSSTQNFEQFTNLSTTSLMSVSTTTAAAATTTTTTTTAANVATSPTTAQSIASTATEPLQRCCICLSDIVRGGIDLHNNIHHIHISCLVSLLNANNRIIWWGTSFGFHCPLCRKPVFGTFMLVS